FSSRRRHTRFSRDWSSDVCSSDLEPFISANQSSPRTIESYVSILRFDGLGDYLFIPTLLLAWFGMYLIFKQKNFFLLTWIILARSEERRVGKECRSWWSGYE